MISGPVLPLELSNVSSHVLSPAFPYVPGYHGSDRDPELLAQEASRIGYPVLFKAIHGGGSKGMRTVHAPAEFAEGLTCARREAEKSFGNDDVPVERYVVLPRHVEVQVVADS
jgi:3-methylcrotonyl-CoA carboxylase alpha subunit